MDVRNRVNGSGGQHRKQIIGLRIGKQCGGWAIVRVTLNVECRNVGNYDTSVSLEVHTGFVQRDDPTGRWIISQH